MGLGDPEVHHHFLMHAGTGAEIDAQFRARFGHAALVDGGGLAEHGAGIVEEDVADVRERGS